MTTFTGFHWHRWLGSEIRSQAFTVPASGAQSDRMHSALVRLMGFAQCRAEVARGQPQRAVEVLLLASLTPVTNTRI